MTNILVVYAGDHGNTKKMAETVARGAGRVADTRAVVKTAEEVKDEDFLFADGVLVGSPVHMGSPDWRVKALMTRCAAGCG